MSRIKINEIFDNVFYQLPKEFFHNPKYMEMTLEAKVLYSFLRDRSFLSAKNNWINEAGEIFLIFARETVQKLLCLSDKPVTKAFKQLNKYGLIEEVKQGMGKPNLIYICRIEHMSIEESVDMTDFEKNRKNSESRVGENTIIESEKVRGNDTDNNNTENKEDKPLPSKKRMNKKAYDTRDSVFLTDKEYNDLCNTYSKQYIDDLIDNMSLYIGTYNKKYKNHNLALQNWIKKDKNKPQPKELDISSDEYWENFKKAVKEKEMKSYVFDPTTRTRITKEYAIEHNIDYIEV